ncbi:hypothetical protein TNCV_148291 [Trichonephila clavipes]|nr:hypothetical protein TNCV_148291 [Trichonephila clavipes]
MPSPVQSNCDAHDTIANGQYGAVWSMGHTQQDDISVFCRHRTSNMTSPCRLLHIPVVLNDFHSRETTLFVKLDIDKPFLTISCGKFGVRLRIDGGFDSNKCSISRPSYDGMIVRSW